MPLDVSNTDLLSCCSVVPTALERRGGKSKYPAEMVLKPFRACWRRSVRVLQVSPHSCAYGKISTRAASPDAVLLSAVLTVAYEEAAPEPAGCA